MKEMTLFFVVILLASCVSEKKEGVVVSDATLIGLANNISSYTYYRNSEDTLVSDPSSPHGLFMRVRFDPRSTSAMKDSMSALNGATFPDESMIVKEYYDFEGGPLSGYLIMYKLSKGVNSNYDWLWAEYNPDGTSIYSVSNNGIQCISCHLATSNSDLVRTFSLH